MSNTQNKVPGYSKKIPCNETRYFFEKVKGKQFHPKESACDEFTVRLQIRKRHFLDWNAVAYQLCITDWVNQFHTVGMTSGNSTKLVSSFRIRSGDHEKCQKASPSYKKSLKEYKKGKKNIVFPWPKKCLVEKK